MTDQDKAKLALRLLNHCAGSDKSTKAVVEDAIYGITLLATIAEGTHQIVPKDPSNKILEAGRIAFVQQAEEFRASTGLRHDNCFNWGFLSVWRAMLKAAEET
jgi:hypothetical protein